MALHVVGTQRNKLNTRASIGFYIWDSDSNTVQLLSTKELRDVILTDIDAVRNVELSEQTEFGKVQGKYYNLDKFTQMVGDQQLNVLSDYTVLDRYNNDIFLIIRFDGNNIEKKLCSPDEIYLLHYNVWNYGLGSHMYPMNRNECNVNRPNMQQTINSEALSLKDRLIEQAYNKNIVWTLSEFKEFMNIMGWKYTLRQTATTIPGTIRSATKCSDYMYEIYDIDANCEVLHLPIEICGIYNQESLFESEPTKINTIILGCFIKQIRGLYSQQIRGIRVRNSSLAKLKGCNLEDIKIPESYEQKQLIINNAELHNTNIQNIYRQPRQSSYGDFMQTSELRLEAFTCLNILGEIELNCEDMTLYNAFCMCNINEIPVIKAKDIRYSFSQVKAPNNVIEIETNSIYASFCKCNIADKSTVILKGSINAISHSFNEINIENIDMSQLVQVKDIIQSFKYAYNLKVFNMSHITAMMNKFGSGNLQGCENLEVVELPQRIMTIGSRNICNSPKVKRVIIPEDTNMIYGEAFINGSVEVVFPKKVTKLEGKYMQNFSNAKEYNPVYQNVITELTCTLPQANGRLEDLKLPVTIKALPESCFFESMLTSYDSRLLPEITKIPNKAFSASHIEEVLLLDNITSIGEEVFSRCGNTKVIIFGKNIKEMPSRIFKDFKPAGITRVFVVRGSLPHKKIKSNLKIVVTVVDSVEEALEMCDSNITSEKKQSKYTMLLRDTPYESLLNENCIAGISYLYPLFSSLDKDESYLQEDIQLDTSKFMPIDINNIKTIKYLLESKIEGVITNCKIQQDNRRFISLCNLITTLSDNCETCFSDYFIHNMNVIYEVKWLSTCYIYLGEHDSIFFIKVRQKDTETIVLCIVYQDKLVYMTNFWSSSYAKVVGYINVQSLYRTSRSHTPTYTNIGLGTILQPGDRFIYRYSSDLECTLHGLKIPNNWVSKVEANILNTSIIIGGLNFEKKSKQKKQDNMQYDLLLYEVMNSKFIECTAEVEFIDVDNTTINYIKLQSIRQVLGLKDINKINPEYFSWLSSGFNNVQSRNSLKLLGISDQELQEAKSNMDNYDLDGDMNITYLGELIYQNGIKSVDDLIKNRSILKRLLDSHLYDNANISMNYIKKYDNVYKRNLLLPLGVKNEILMEFEAKDNQGNNMYITGLADGNTTMSSKKFLMGSMISVERAVKLLYMIGFYRSNSSHKAILGIDNNPTDISKMYIFMTKTLSYFNTHGMKLHVAFDLYNADTYILGEIWDMSFYKLFRTKNMVMGIQLFRLLTSKEYNMETNTMDLLRDLDSGAIKYLSKSNESLKSLRRDIMNGLPNNTPYAGKYLNIAEILAKQPKAK